MLKIIDKIIVSDKAPKGKNVLWLQPSEKGYQIKVNSGGGYTTINNGSSGEHEYVDLGLPSGTLWATCNVGATKPEEYGNYYAWGETQTKNKYTYDNSLTYNKEFFDISGNCQYDAARVHWGNAWRIPTYDECNELRTKCTWTWITQNGINGYNVKGPNGNSIFLPAAGSNEASLSGVGEVGEYWSSTPYNNSSSQFNNTSYDLYFNIGGQIAYSHRFTGKSVRPVKSK